MSSSNPKMGGIYRVNLSSTHFYVGRSSDISRRVRVHQRHLEHGRHPNTYMQRVYDQHHQFNWEVLTICPSVAEAVVAEQAVLDRLVGTTGCMNLSRNAVYGPGMAGKTHTESAKKKIREARAHQVCSDETKQKMAIASRGNTRAKGHRHQKSDELRRRMSEGQKGRVLSEIHRQALSEAWENRAPASSRTRDTLSNSLRAHWELVRQGLATHGKIKARTR